jgi:hypothetical protein
MQVAKYKTVRLLSRHHDYMGIVESRNVHIARVLGPRVKKDIMVRCQVALHISVFWLNRRRRLFKFSGFHTEITVT